MSTHSSPPTKNHINSEVVCKLKRTQEEYLEDRVQYKINRYTKKANRYRFAYYGIVGVAAVGSALVPALINLELGTLVPTIIALVVAAAVALEGVFHTRKHWRNYDLISSLLREEEMRFSTKIEPYSTSGQEKENDKVFKKFVERVENACSGLMEVDTLKRDNAIYRKRCL